MKQPFYLKTWFIGVLFAFWFVYGIPLVIGIFLVFLQNKKKEELFQKYGDIGQAELKLCDLDRTYKEKANKLMSEERKTKKEIAELKKEITVLETESEVRQFDFSDYSGLSSEECKNKLSMLKLDEKELVRSGNAFVLEFESDKKRLNNNKKQILRCFNAECDNILQNVSVKRIDAMRKKIATSFDSLNKIFSINGVALNRQLLECKLEELNLVYSYELKKEEEKEIRREIREQMLEEEKVRKEIEREKVKIEKDKTQFSNEIRRLMNYMQKASNDPEKQLYIDKIKELEDKIKELQERENDVLQREVNARAGFVYIISNIGSFGENIYKIGMTRRLEPMDRIKELSSASVPFGFDVHAMIFSDDAPALESILHKHFEKQSVNRVNSRKEFFRVSLDEIEKVVTESFNNTVIFTEYPPAFEYRQTLEILENEKKNVV